jgi:monoamine oxidase
MPDILILGAGVAGISAAISLAQSGLSVTILEARDRIGGRVFTRHDSEGNPVELGAEFIHGRPPEILDILHQENIPFTELAGQPWCVRDNQLRPCDFFSDVDYLLEKMDDHSPDESFLDFLARHPEAPTQVRDRALAYVTGFNAADPAQVSVHWLVQSMRAEEQLHGDHTYRMAGGYATLLKILHKRLHELGVAVHLDTIAERVRWSPGQVEVAARHNEDAIAYSAPRVLITVPLGVLQAPPGEPGAIEFSPPLPPQKKDALSLLDMGKVLRITLRFRERFWSELRPDGAHSLDRMGFLFTLDEQFPTWWTMMPEKIPLITGWAPFRAAEYLSGEFSMLAFDSALDSLSRPLRFDRKKLDDLLEAAFVHDWQSDPFSRGAYSYVKVGGEHAPRELALPIENTLFFAGEATDTTSNTGTVHAAIASARRAATEILTGCRKA